ncbi:hypothetical protein FQZ97_937840 [compost metagenome]
MGDLLQGGPCIVELVEQVLDVEQVALFALQLLVGPCRAQAGGDAEERNAGNDQRELQAVVGTLQLQGNTGRHHQIQRPHAGEMHGRNGQAHQQAGAILQQLVAPTGALAEVQAQQKCGKAGDDGNQDRQGEKPGVVVEVGAGAYRRHAAVMHGRDTQADENGRAQVLADA